MPVHPAALRAALRRHTLRLATLNVAGRLANNTTALAHLAVDYEVDVLALQEVKLGAGAVAALVRRLNVATAARAAARRRAHTGFVCRAAPNTTCVGRAGVLLLFRRSLCSSGALELQGEADTDFDWGGRMVSATASWGGHTMQFVSAYCPNDPAGRAAFLSTTVAAAWQRRPQGTVMMGDWNFVPAPQQDRRSQSARRGDTHGDASSLAALRAAAPGAVDLWRLKHPGRRQFTFFSEANGHAARHDRAYGSVALAPYVLGCRCVPAAFSDHDMVLTDLAPALGAKARGPGLPRARLDFMASAQHAAALRRWLGEELQAAPATEQALLAWWPRLKHKLRLKMLQLHRGWKQACPQLDYLALVQEVEDAKARLGAATTQQQSDAAMHSVLAARTALRRHQQQQCARCDRLQRLQWLHQGERPQPAITEQVRALGGGSSAKLVTLRAASGRLVCDRAEPAEVAAVHYAHVSRQPVVDASAHATVMAAVQAQQPDGSVEADGSPEVSQAEVRAAMASSRPGTAPGPDGLPLTVYKRFRDLLLPVLVRVFAAVGSTGVVPPHFLDGAISTILKPGANPLEAAGYRPITLLNTDYRLLARVLADRLQPAMQAVVSPSQTAFLRGRRSGSNILCLQLLADGLPSDSTIVAALLDFAKAYDTIDRPFLLEVLRVLGVGDAFCKWVRTLLTATKACAVVNGYASGLKPFEAGVRQGCPLSPLLYLCVAEALCRFLKQQGVGVTAFGVPLTCTQFADDTQVYLPSPAAVPEFLQLMETFAAATGQRLNVGKTKILLLGRAARVMHAQQQRQQQQQQQQQPAPQFVTSAKVLGVMIGEHASALADRVDGVLAAFGRLSRVPSLSAFGRGLGSAAYGVSKLLYAAEFSDVPEPGVCVGLSGAMAKLVDRGVAPDYRGPRLFAGVRWELLQGRPAHGGFGAMPWREHILARHAWWGAQFVSAPADTAEPWILIGRAICRSLDMAWGPMFCLDGITMPAGTPPAIRRMMGGLRALGRPSVVCAPVVEGAAVVQQQGSAPVLTPGPWCADAPLWGNLYATAPGAPPQGPQGLQVLPRAALSPQVSAGGQVRPYLLSVGDALRALRVVHARAGGGDPYTGPWADAGSEYADLGYVLGALPAGWVQAAAAVVPAGTAAVPDGLEAWLLSDGMGRPFARRPSDSELRVECGLVAGLGWRLGRTRVSVSSLTVKQATALQLGPLVEMRAQYRSDFVDAVAPLAVRGNPAEVAVCRAAVVAAHKSLWKLRWDNHFKEVFWRLVFNGLPTAERMHMTDRECVCGPVEGGQPGRRHHFWECPVAQAVVGVMQQQLVGWMSGALQSHHVLCMRCPEPAPGAGGAPGPAMHKGLWRVVCLAAINAMDGGRRAANSVGLEQRQQQRDDPAAQQAAAAPADQRLITTMLQPAALTAAQQQHRGQVQQRQQTQAQLVQQQQQQQAAARLAEAKQEAVGRFWDLLQDVVALSVVPGRWCEGLHVDHPFLRVVDGAVVVHQAAIPAQQGGS